MKSHEFFENPTLDDILATNTAARAAAEEAVEATA